MVRSWLHGLTCTWSTNRLICCIMYIKSIVVFFLGNIWHYARCCVLAFLFTWSFALEFFLVHSPFDAVALFFVIHSNSRICRLTSFSRLVIYGAHQWCRFQIFEFDDHRLGLEHHHLHCNPVTELEPLESMKDCATYMAQLIMVFTLYVYNPSLCTLNQTYSICIINYIWV